MNLVELINKGLSFEEFVNQDEDLIKDKIMHIYNSINLAETAIKRIQSIKNPIYIIVFAEIWCPDCILNVPALQKISDTNPLINITILPREGNCHYLSAYKLEGKIRIPTFIAFDMNYKELGAYIETPQILKDILSRGSEIEKIVAKRKYKKGEYINNTIEDMMKIITK